MHYEEQKEKLSLIVVQGVGPSLLGRDWLKKIRLDWKEIHKIVQSPLQRVLQKHEVVWNWEH